MNTKKLLWKPVLAILTTPLPAVDNAVWLARVEGVGMSRSNPSPFGPIGFGMDMVKDVDGSTHWPTPTSIFYSG